MKTALILLTTTLICNVSAFFTPAPETAYLGPETVVDITPAEALADPDIIRINTPGSLDPTEL